MTRRQSEGTEAHSDEAQRKAIQAQIKIITEARAKVEAAMRNLPWSARDKDTIVPLLSEKYMDLAKSSAEPQAKSDIEAQISEIKEKATDLLMNLCGLNTLAVDAIHLAMKEGDYPPKERLLLGTAAMVVDPRPKALGDIMGRLEVLIDATGRAEALGGKSRRGPDQKGDALEIAKAAATDYLVLTGRLPNRSYKDSSFVDFLAAIFKALGRQGDSVDNFARQAIKWLENERVREDEDAIKRTNPPLNLDDAHVAVSRSWWQRCHLRQ